MLRFDANKESFEDALLKLEVKKDLMVGIVDQDIISLIEDISDEYRLHYKPDIVELSEALTKSQAEYMRTMERLISARNLIAELQAKVDKIAPMPTLTTTDNNIVDNGDNSVVQQASE